MNNKLSRIAAALLSLLLLLTALPVAGSAADSAAVSADRGSSEAARTERDIYSGTCGDNLTWTLDTDSHTLTISGYGAMYDYHWYDSMSSSSPPWFGIDYHIQNVFLPDGLTRIGSSAFSGCYQISSIFLPSSLQSIGDYAFTNCVQLSSLMLPERLTEIGESVFDSCDNLFSIDVAPGNPSFSSIDGVLFNKSGTKLLAYPNGRISNPCFIQEGVTSIGKAAFRRHHNLMSIVLPNSLTSIEAKAFEECGMLENVQFGSGLLSIGDQSFSACMNLSSLVFPSSLKSIGERAFHLCHQISDIELPSGLESLGDFVFGDNWNLSSITVAPGSSHFSSVDGILYDYSGTELVLYPCGRQGEYFYVPEGVTSIGRCAFYRCNHLQSIDLPASLTNIEDCAFVECPFESLNISPGNTSFIVDNAVLYNSLHTELIAIQRINWYENGTFIIPEGVSSIRGGALSGNGFIYGVSLPSSLRTIGDYAFLTSTGIEGITLPSGLTSIGKYAFSHCPGLYSIVIPSSVTHIGEGAFKETNTLQSATFIGRKPATINADTFYCCDPYFTIYYTFPYASSWAPNGETDLYGWNLVQVMPEPVYNPGAPTFSVGSASCLPGNQFSVPVSIDGDYSANGISFSIYYDPNIIEFVSVSNGPVLEDITAKGGIFDCGNTAPGEFTFMGVLPDQSESTSGVLFTLTFSVPQDVPVGTFCQLFIAVDEFYSSPGGFDNIPLAYSTVFGSVSVTFLPGDVDGDGRLSSFDSLLAMRHALSLIVLSPEYLERADYDGNGYVDVIDALQIIRKAIGLI